jgi:gluconate 2-dehydrogenase subunit 3-like protein
MAKSISRRDVLRSLTVGVTAGSVLSVIPVEAAEHVHKLIAKEKAAASGRYSPKFFPPDQYQTLRVLCETIFPADSDSGGAIEAAAPEFIDLLTSENSKYQLMLGGGIMWLDSTCNDRYGATFRNCSLQQQKEILDLIAYRKNADADPGLSQGVTFFSLLRNLTADGFFTSEIGIKYLGYEGNTVVREFRGCPPVPEA